MNDTMTAPRVPMNDGVPPGDHDPQLAAVLEREGRYSVLPVGAIIQHQRTRDAEEVEASLAAVESMEDLDFEGLAKTATRPQPADVKGEVLKDPTVAPLVKKLLEALQAHGDATHALDKFHPVLATPIMNALEQQMLNPATSQARLSELGAELSEVKASSTGQRRPEQLVIQRRLANSYSASVLPAAHDYLAAGLSVARRLHVQALMVELAFARIHDLPQPQNLRVARRARAVVAEFKAQLENWEVNANKNVSFRQESTFGLTVPKS